MMFIEGWAIMWRWRTSEAKVRYGWLDLTAQFTQGSSELGWFFASASDDHPILVIFNTEEEAQKKVDEMNARHKNMEWAVTKVILNSKE